MGAIVSANAIMTCTFGMMPSVFQPTNCTGVMAQGIVANVMDASPSNIPPFGMCTSMMNPMVVTATALALGVLTPQPCTLLPAGIWIPTKPTILIKNAPALTMDAKLMCAYGGVIQFSNTPSMKVML